MEYARAVLLMAFIMGLGALATGNALSGVFRDTTTGLILESTAAIAILTSIWSVLSDLRERWQEERERLQPRLTFHREKAGRAFICGLFAAGTLLPSPLFGAPPLTVWGYAGDTVVMASQVLLFMASIPLLLEFGRTMDPANFPHEPS